MIDKNFALIYGCLLGDGCLSRVGNHRFVILTCDIHSDEAFMKNILPIMEELRGKKIRIKRKPKQGSIEMNFSLDPQNTLG